MSKVFVTVEVPVLAMATTHNEEAVLKQGVDTLKTQMSEAGMNRIKIEDTKLSSDVSFEGDVVIYGVEVTCSFTQAIRAAQFSVIADELAYIIFE